MARVLKARAAELLVAEASGRPLPLPWRDADVLRPLVLERFGPFRAALIGGRRAAPSGRSLRRRCLYRLWGVNTRLSRATAVELVVVAAGTRGSMRGPDEV